MATWLCNTVFIITPAAAQPQALLHPERPSLWLSIGPSGSSYILLCSLVHSWPHRKWMEDLHLSTTDWTQTVFSPGTLFCSLHKEGGVATSGGRWGHTWRVKVWMVCLENYVTLLSNNLLVVPQSKLLQKMDLSGSPLLTMCLFFLLFSGTTTECVILWLSFWGKKPPTKYSQRIYLKVTFDFFKCIFNRQI